MTLIKFCVFLHTEDKYPKPKELPWKILAKDLTRHRVTQVNKNQKNSRINIPLLSLATYKPNTTRAAYNVETVNAAALDIDNINPKQWQNIQNNIQKNKISSFWYTTYNSTLNNIKIRLILQLSRPVIKQEWDKIYPVFQSIFSTDPSTKDACRMFFGPYIAPDTEENHFSGIQEGIPLNVELLLKQCTSIITDIEQPPPGNTVVTKEMLTVLIKKLKRRTDPNDQISARLLTNIKNKEKFTEEGHRDNAIFQYVVKALVKEWECIDVDKFTELATQSLELTGGVTPEQFKNKLERAKENRQQWLEQLAREKREKHEKALAKISLSRKSVGINSYYVDEKLPLISSEAMISREKFDIPIAQAKVVQHQNDFYFWCNGTYVGPIQKNAFISAAVKYLSPFEEIEKELFNNNGDLKDIDVNNFINKHGQFVSEVIFNMGSSETSLSNDALILPYYPPISTQPKYSWRVEAWLNFLFGGCAKPKNEALNRVEWAKKWLCLYQNHSLLLPAILFVGATGAGKGLFAEFLCHAYEIPAINHSLNMYYNTGTENDIYPVMVADEEFPKVEQSLIREGITKKVHTLKKKYQNIRHVRGYVRHLFLLNDADRIKTFDVGVEAQKATAERFMYVPVTEHCTEYLKILCANNEYLQPGELQMHIEWLKASEYLNLEPSRGRFAVEVPSDNQSFYETFYRQKDRFEVLDVICHFICKEQYPNGLEERYGGLPIQVTRDQRVIIKTSQFVAYCREYIDQGKSKIVRILKSIASTKKDENGRYWELDTNHLYKWAEIAMEYGDEEINFALNTTTESKIDSVEALENSWN